MDDDNYEDDYIVDFQRVSEDKHTHPICRLLAHDLTKRNYITPGEWLQGIHDSQLSELVHMIDDGENKSVETLVLLTLMLTSAEGLPINNDKDLATSFSILQSLIAVTSLHRKGLILAHYDKMSFGPDAMNNIVAEKMPGIDYTPYAPDED